MSVIEPKKDLGSHEDLCIEFSLYYVKNREQYTGNESLQCRKLLFQEFLKDRNEKT
jgi:hypothetical protein